MAGSLFAGRVVDLLFLSTAPSVFHLSGLFMVAVGAAALAILSPGEL